MDRRTKVLAVGGAALALAAGGVAVADASSIGTQTMPAHKNGGRGFLRPRKLTHADLHLYLQGRDVEIRVDRGVVVSTTAGSITLRELDGAEVTIPVDSSTRVMRRGRPTRLADLHAGDLAFAARQPPGRPARVVRSPGRRGRQ